MTDQQQTKQTEPVIDDQELKDEELKVTIVKIVNFIIRVINHQSLNYFRN